MKRTVRRVLLTGLGFLLFSCSGIDTPLPLGKGWTRSLTSPSKGSMRIGIVRADKTADWNSLEREIEGLLPLLLLDQGYLSAGEGADYRIDAVAIEREYLSGWLTKRSLSVEIRIWKDDGDALPLSAGRAVLSGDQSLASSKVLTRLLQLALSKALAGLEHKPERGTGRNAGR